MHWWRRAEHDNKFRGESYRPSAVAGANLPLSEDKIRCEPRKGITALVTLAPATMTRLLTKLRYILRRSVKCRTIGALCKILTLEPGTFGGIESCTFSKWQGQQTACSNIFFKKKNSLFLPDVKSSHPISNGPLARAVM